MRIAILFSGGKDSTYTILKSFEEGHEVKYLFTVKPKNKDSYMFHSVALDITKIQAELMNIKHFYIEVSGEKEKEVEELIEKLREFSGEIDAIGIGGIKSKYQYIRFKKVCDELNLKLYMPLHNIDCEKYWKVLLEKKFKIIITKISAGGLDKELLGKIIDEKILNELIYKSKKFGFDLCFEGGEAETLVLDCPLFKREIKLKKFKLISENLSHFLEIEDIEIVDKSNSL
ncbi:MAG: diphthine--ammonia ligase [Candidatus Aenigmatarchaeota archaeon]